MCEIHKVNPKSDGWDSVTTKGSSELWNREMNQALERKIGWTKKLMPVTASSFTL